MIFKQRLFRKNRLVMLILVISVSIARSQEYEPNWKSLDARPIPEWFQDAKFGIFIHWGVYSVPAWAPADLDVGDHFGLKYAEWYWDQLVNKNPHFVKHHQETYGNHVKYQDFAGQFKAENFDPDKWAQLFKDAGAKYVVLTSKHHEGFTLWPSKQSWNWNAVDIGPHRDLLGDLTKSVKNAGLHMGYYYSLLEWFNPLYHDHIEKYVDEHMIPQMKDLVETYKPDILWTDGEWGYRSDTLKSEAFLSWLYNKSSVKDSIVVNDRWGKETRSVHGGFYTTEYGTVNEKKGIDDKAFHPWEECRGIGTSFGYNKMENLQNYESSESLIHLLIDKVSHGGNLLLDVGPTADGRIPVIMQQRLSDIGSWLKVNGEAIYGTHAWKNQPIYKTNEPYYFTVKGNDVFIVCTKWPEKNIIIPGLSKVTKVTMLGSPANVVSHFKNGTLTVIPPKLNPGNVPCNYAWVFKIENGLPIAK